MINCPRCKEEIDNDSLYCDQCGQEILFCVSCHRPGKGKRCTFCGGRMDKPNAQPHPMDEEDSNMGLQHVTIRETANPNTLGSRRSGIPQMFLVNDSLHMRLAAKDGAILGRNAGEYKHLLAPLSYISGQHARLNYMPGSGWCIVDLHSSNGTSVNRRRLMSDMPALLRRDDRILLANVEFRIEIVS